MSDYDARFWSRQGGDDFWTPYLRADLQENSRALVGAMKEVIGWPIDEPWWCHEMGGNLGRNLWHIDQAYPKWVLSANDINPLAIRRCEQTYPDLPVIYSAASSQEWMENTFDAVMGRWEDIVLSSDHFIHIEDLTPFRETLPRIVRRYLVLRESAGVNPPGSPYYRYWTDVRQQQGKSRWFDHDCAAVFEGTSLKLIYRQRQRTYNDRIVMNGEVVETERAYDIYIFEQTAGVDDGG